MNDNVMILAKDTYFDLDTRQTKLNNNVIVVGTSGSGKTRSIVTPNLLKATGSYIISDPKGNLYKQYRHYMEKQGYVVKYLSFIDPEHSMHYNFFHYIRSHQDIVKIAHMMIYASKESGGTMDPFWDEAAQLLLQSILGYLWEFRPEHEQNLESIMKLLHTFSETGDFEMEKTIMDRIMDEVEKRCKDSVCLRDYKSFRVAASKTLRSIVISVNARVGRFCTPELYHLMEYDNMAIEEVGKQKTVIFVAVSDNDRSLDGLANIFFTQAMQELCRVADLECKDYKLPVPVRFIMDDFATNCKIADFPKMIASIRSREISAMIMVQTESQLTAGYGEDGRTIIGNCDTYIYLGGNDLETAQAVAQRCNLPLRKILYMPVETNWIFRRGMEPMNGHNFDLDELLEQLDIGDEQAEQLLWEELELSEEDMFFEEEEMFFEEEEEQRNLTYLTNHGYISAREDCEECDQPSVSDEPSLEQSIEHSFAQSDDLDHPDLEGMTVVARLDEETLEKYEEMLNEIMNQISDGFDSEKLGKQD